MLMGNQPTGNGKGFVVTMLWSEKQKLLSHRMTQRNGALSELFLTLCCRKQLAAVPTLSEIYVATLPSFLHCRHLNLDYSFPIPFKIISEKLSQARVNSLS